MLFQIAAFLILLIFYSSYFLKMLSQRKKGIKTDQIGKGKKGLSKFIEVTMKIVTIFVPVAEVISIIINTTHFSFAVRFVGMGIAMTGCIVFILSVITMKDSWRAGVSESERTDLITNGIYRYSRNPAFLGFDLVYIGILLVFFHWILLLISAIAILVFHLQILFVEEKFLMQAFGSDYACYRNVVHRYFGRSLSDGN